MTEVQKTATGGGNQQDALTQRINAKYREVEEMARSTVQGAIELGGMLTDKKAELPHGSFGKWIAEYFEGSERHAQRFMKLHRERETLLANPTRVSDLSIRGALQELTESRKEIPGSTYEVAEGLWKTASDSPSHLADAIAKLIRDHGDAYVRGVLGFAWIRAFQEYKVAVETPQEDLRLEALKALDRHVRPVDLPVGRDRFDFEDELTYREMFTTFADLFAQEAIVGHESVAHNIRVMHTLYREVGEEAMMRYFKLLDQGTVRPVEEKEVEWEEIGLEAL